MPAAEPRGGARAPEREEDDEVSHGRETAMLNVTARAREQLWFALDEIADAHDQRLRFGPREQLWRALDEIAEDPEQGLRFGPTSPGQLGVFPDIEQEDDQVVEHDGHPVLVLDREIVDALAGWTIDVEETEEGPRFVLKA